VNLEMQSELAIKQIWLYIWRPSMCQLGGGDRASSEIHLQAMMEGGWRPYSWEFGDALGRHDFANFEAMMV